MQSSTEFWDAVRRWIEDCERFPKSLPRIKRVLRQFERRRIDSFAELHDALPTLSVNLRRNAAWLLGHAKRRIAVPILLELLEDPQVCGEAACTLGPKRDARARAAAVKIMLNSEYPYIRCAAAYALTCMADGAEVDPILLDPILLVVTDHHEHALVRAQAIEAIGMMEHGDRRRRRFRQTVETLIALLSDDSPHVRFWSCYALGLMRAKQALPALRRLKRTDRVMCPGWWLISEEAADAIEWIHGRPGKERTCSGNGDAIDPNEVRPRRTGGTV